LLNKQRAIIYNNFVIALLSSEKNYNVTVIQINLTFPTSNKYKITSFTSVPNDATQDGHGH